MNLSLMVIIVGSFILTTSYVRAGTGGGEKKDPMKNPCRGRGYAPDGFSKCGMFSNCYCQCYREPGMGNSQWFDNEDPPSYVKCRKKYSSGRRRQKNPTLSTPNPTPSAKNPILTANSDVGPRF